MKSEKINYILEKGTDLILKNGYHNIGLKKILTEANIPKGSFYYYFQSKEDFGLQVIKHYSKKGLNFIESSLTDESKDEKQRIISFFRDLESFYKMKNFREGCLLGNCSLELSDFSDSFRTLIASEFEKWQKCFEICIEKGQKNGVIKSEESASILSDLILTLWEGTMVRMKSSKSIKSLDWFVSYMEKHML